MMTLLIFLAGWSSASRFSAIGSVRSALQMLSYEIPLGLVLVCPAIRRQEASPVSGIVQWQAENATLGAALQPLGLAVTIVCLLAELELVPFDIPEAETEIVAGWKTEFTGWRLALLRLGRDLEVVLVAALVASLYLGGAQPLWFIPATAMFVVKTAAVVMVFSFARALFARFRIDQMISGMWKYLLPIAALQVVLVQIGVGV